MDYSVEKLKEDLGKIKFPKFKRKLRLREVKVPAVKIKPPSRAVIVTVAIIIELFLVFLAFWIFDDRTSFANDYIEKRSYSSLSRWGWVHKGVATMIILMLVAWLITIISEFAAYDEDGRPFYRIYKNRDRNRY